MFAKLTTTLKPALQELERRVLEKRTEIEHWFRGEWLEHPVTFYASVDLRNSGFKLAPVDTNLFPGGFNNLSPSFMPLCVQAAMSAGAAHLPDTRRFLLIPENTHAKPQLPAERRGIEAHPRGGRPAGAHRKPHPGPEGADERRDRRGREAAAGTGAAPRQSPGRGRIRSMRDPQQQRSFGRNSRDPARPRAAGRAPDRCRMEHAEEDPPFSTSTIASPRTSGG